MYTFVFYGFPLVALLLAYRAGLPKSVNPVDRRAFFMRSVLFVVVAIAVGHTIFRLAFPEYTHRFRVTIAVDDNGRHRVGAGIVTVTFEDIDYLLVNQDKWNVSTWGPSPWVDLGNKGIIAMAINLPYPITEPVPYGGGWLSFVAYYGAQHHDPKLSDDNIKNISRQTGTRALKPDQMPQFIWFPDPKNPSSAQLTPVNKFEQIIGPGVKLESVTVEITQDRPDDSLYAELPWLSALRREEARKLVLHGSPFVIHADNLLGDL